MIYHAYESLFTLYIVLSLQIYVYTSHGIQKSRKPSSFAVLYECDSNKEENQISGDILIPDEGGGWLGNGGRMRIKMAIENIDKATSACRVEEGGLSWVKLAKYYT